MKAAVRGTAFSVSTFDDLGQVAVLEGKVMVTINDNISEEAIKETYVENGEMAIVRSADTEADLKKFTIQITSLSIRLNRLQYKKLQ